VELQESLADFEANGIGLVAISVDPPATGARMRDARDLDFPLLSDQDAVTIDAYDVRHPLLKLALPAVFILDSDAIIQWSQVGANKQDRAPTDEVLAAALEIAGGVEDGPTPRAVSPGGKAATTWAAVKARD
jgi:peroxiredoxin